jgi:hypothetical protein
MLELSQESQIVDTAKLRQERHLCSQHATSQPSPVGAAYSGNHIFLAGVVHSFSMSLLTELENVSGFVATKISLLAELCNYAACVISLFCAQML